MNLHLILDSWLSNPSETREALMTKNLQAMDTFNAQTSCLTLIEQKWARSDSAHELSTSAK